MSGEVGLLLFIWGIIAWIGCGVYVYGRTFAYFQCHWPTLTEDTWRESRVLSFCASLAGPLALPAVWGTTENYGMMFTRKGVREWISGKSSVKSTSSPWPGPPPPPGPITAAMLNNPYLPSSPPACPTSDLPLVAGPIVAERGWRLAKDEHGAWALAPLGVRADPWPKGRPYHAHCIRGDAGSGTAGYWTADSLHSAPVADCTCGVWAVPSARELQEDYAPHVTGTVALWGRVVECERGWRGEFAYPVRLVLEVTRPMPGFPVPDEVVEQVRDLTRGYGVPVEMRP